MKKLLNTLFVSTEGTYLRKERETVVAEVNRKKVLQLPMLSLSNIFCFGRVNLSPQFMASCAEKGVGVAFFSQYGKFQVRMQGPQTGNVLLRRQQYRWSDDQKKSADISKFIVASKLFNSRTVLQRFLRNNAQSKNCESVAKVVENIKYAIRKLKYFIDIDEIRGSEGQVANNYFSVFNYLIIKQENDFIFSGRNRRPPKDAVNALLSFIYAVMLQDCVSALEGVGLDPYVGFLHRDRPGRQSLALDIQEEFRAFIGDRLALSLINLKQLKKKDFVFTESGAVLLGDKVKKIVLASYQKRKQEELIHPILKEKVPIGLLFYTQALLLAKYIRGDIDYYPAFVWR